MKTLIRLDASTYQRMSFFKKEKDMAASLGLNYLYCDLRNRGITMPLPDEYQGPFALISNTHTACHKVPAALLKETKLWLHPNSGYDNFDAQWVEAQKFPIILGQSIRASAVSEYILAHLFSHFSFHPHQREWPQTRGWDRTLLTQKRVTILGKGHVGAQVGQALQGLCRVTYFDPYRKDEDLYQGSLQELCKTTDILILCAGLNKGNRGLLNREIFNILPSDILIINSARGELIEEDQLLSFLKENPHAFAYLDVFQEEPFSPQRFTGIENIHCTAHIAGVSKELEKALLNFEEEALKRFIHDPHDLFIRHFKNALLKKRIINGELI